MKFVIIDKESCLRTLAKRFGLDREKINYKEADPSHQYITLADAIRATQVRRWIIEHGIALGYIAVTDKFIIPSRSRARIAISHQDTLKYIEMVNKARGILGQKKLKYSKFLDQTLVLETTF